jgi:hypothetical protein
MKYSSSFTYDLSVGEVAEDWVNEIFNGKQFIEVKTDRLAHKTGNIFIEYECRNKPSGIATTTATYWIYKIDKSEVAIIVSVDRLKEICRVAYLNNKKCNGGDDNLSKGVLVPIRDIFNITNLKVEKNT